MWHVRGDSAKKGAQIDLLLDRADGCINLCEIKYADQAFELTKKYAEELEQKKEIFRSETGCKKSLFTTMITTRGLVQNRYTTQFVQAEATMDVNIPLRLFYGRFPPWKGENGRLSFFKQWP